MRYYSTFDPFLLPCVGNNAHGHQPQGQLALPLEGQLFKTKKYILFLVPSKFLLLACYVTFFFFLVLFQLMIPLPMH